MKSPKTLIPNKDLTKKEFAKVMRSVVAQVVRKKNERISGIRLVLNRSIFPIYGLGGKIEPMPLPTHISLEFVVIRKFKK